MGKDIEKARKEKEALENELGKQWADNVYNKIMKKVDEFIERESKKWGKNG